MSEERRWFEQAPPEPKAGPVAKQQEPPPEGEHFFVFGWTNLERGHTKKFTQFSLIQELFWWQI